MTEEEKIQKELDKAFDEIDRLFYESYLDLLNTIRSINHTVLIKKG